jgi:hypothetical protein
MTSALGGRGSQRRFWNCVVAAGTTDEKLRDNGRVEGVGENVKENGEEVTLTCGSSLQCPCYVGTTNSDKQSTL